MHAMSSSQASSVKRKGHQREVVFNQKYGDPSASINHSGASADCLINDQGLMNRLNVTIGVSDNSVSLKGGNTIQIHLGNLPELTNKEDLIIENTNEGYTKVHHGIGFDEQISVLKDKGFWDKYLRKGETLIYDFDNGHYICFNMDDVIDFIIKECEWRLLDTGRLKGDFFGRQYLTYEYRSKKNMFVLGAHGGKKGKEFIELLANNIRSITL